MSFDSFLSLKAILRTGNSVPRAEKFGGLITADHKVLNEGSESRHNHRYSIRLLQRALVILVRLQTSQLGFFGVESKNTVLP